MKKTSKEYAEKLAIKHINKSCKSNGDYRFGLSDIHEAYVKGYLKAVKETDVEYKQF